MTLQSGERSNNTDKVPCDSQAQPPQGTPSASPGNCLRYNHPLVAGQSPARSSFPCKANWPLSHQVAGKGTKAAGPEGQAPGPGAACWAPSHARPRIRAECALCPPAGFPLARSLGLGGRLGGISEAFPKGKEPQGRPGVQDGSRWGRGKLPTTGAPTRCWGGPGVSPSSPSRSPHHACLLPAWLPL